MKLVTLLENTACDQGLCSAHGLSLYIETLGKRILFDTGPDAGFLTNAAKLGVDLSLVDFAVISHGHYDHTGGLEAFLQCNDHAPVYLHQGAFAPHYSATTTPPHYIGMAPELSNYAHRFITVAGLHQISDGLTLFGQVTDVSGAMVASSLLKEEDAHGKLHPDGFQHEQNLLIQEGPRHILVAGCAHCGVVNILRRGEELAGGVIDAQIGGFHLFQMSPSHQTDGHIDAIGQALKSHPTVYYTGHCTGDYAMDRLAPILTNQLQRLTGGAVFTI